MAFEKLHYPDLLEWSAMERCGQANLVKCARYICRIVMEFNDVSRAYERLQLELNTSEKQRMQLADKMENCNSCCFFKTQLPLPKWNTVDNVPFNSEDKENDVRGSLKGDIPKFISPNTSTPSKNSSVEDVRSVSKAPNVASDEVQNTTPRKKVSKRNLKHKSSEESLGEIEETVFLPTSPILHKRKTHKRLSLSEEKRSPSKIPPVACDFDATAECEAGAIEHKISPKNVFNAEDDKTLLDFSYDDILANDKTSFKHSLSDSKKSSVEKPKNKKFKQARLVLTKTKPLVPMDITKSDEFHGGLRKLQSDIVIKSEIKTEKNCTMNSSFDEAGVDEIIESPSCIKKIAKRGDYLKMSKHGGNKVEQGNVEVKMEPAHSQENPNHILKDCIDSKDNVLFGNSENIKKSFVAEPSPQKALFKILSPKKETLREVKYIEDPVRKKAEKKKLQGWSCTKCENFYNAAFRGNSDAKKKRIDECSKHRSKFNPERRNTPPGFWDMNMPPTQDTEAFNQRNNQDLED